MQIKIPFFAIALFFISIFLVISCSTPSNEDLPTVDAQKGSDFKVAALLPQSINDSSWDKSGYDGLQMIKQQLGATVSYQEKIDVPSNQPPAIFQKAFKVYGEKGYDFIIGHGSEFMTAIEASAKEFPRTKFALVGSYAGNNINAGGISYRADEAGYLLGVAAGLATKTNKITLIGNKPFGDGGYFAKFSEKGAKAINPNITESFKWVGNFTDAVKASQMAEDAVKSGSDVLIVICDLFNKSVIKVAQKAGVKTIVLFSDEYDSASKTVLTALLVKYPTIYLQAATLVRQGRWEGKQYRFGFKEGAMELTPFRGQLTSEKEAKFNAIEQDILLGKVDLSS